MLITITSPDDPSLFRLARWLEEDGHHVSARSSGSRPGAQSPLDLIDVVVSNTMALGSLLVSYATWRAAKPHPENPRFTFRRGDVEISLENPTDEEIKRAVEALSDEEP
ncbi:effector-associated constant component EACC1 [Actinoplanes sp. G11-F43]|uniref:effector-associated constant component EACC1 n=1 Tax=Actinoplanes sp. G11-F43 TaxID=3424130 RepID=UPI003D332744